MSDGIKDALGTHYLCRLPQNAQLTKELWDVIMFNYHDPEGLQNILDEMFAVPPRETT